jgi:thiol-disulfide isomerase/thioredoxin
MKRILIAIFSLIMICNINASVNLSDKEPRPAISIDTIGVFGIKNLIKNKSEKLRVINVWATWCGPCVSEFSDFVKLNQKFRDRNFEWVTISADPPKKQSKVLKFLQKKQAIGTNYIFNSEDLIQLIETVDSRWRGLIPYTMIVAPGGKIIYAQEGVINPMEINNIIEGSLR